MKITLVITIFVILVSFFITRQLMVVMDATNVHLCLRGRWKRSLVAIAATDELIFIVFTLTLVHLMVLLSVVIFRL